MQSRHTHPNSRVVNFFSFFLWWTLCTVVPRYMVCIQQRGSKIGETRTVERCRFRVEGVCGSRAPFYARGRIPDGANKLFVVIKWVRGSRVWGVGVARVLCRNQRQQERERERERDQFVQLGNSCELMCAFVCGYTTLSYTLRIV